MRCKRTAMILVICISYGLLSLFSAYRMLNKYNSGMRRSLASYKNYPFNDASNKHIKTANTTWKNLEIWDTTGDGLYLWKHILQGILPETDHNGWLESALVVENLNIWYRYGYGLMPKQSPPVIARNLILVLDGRNDKVRKHATAWLNYSLSNSYMINLGLILMGDESCNNNWLEDYLKKDVIKVVFLTYDSPLIDEKRIFGWPLGVAVNFPSAGKNLDVTGKRQYTCNFVGTVFPKSSRQDIMNFVQEKSFSNNRSFFFKWRNRFVRNNDLKSVNEYSHALANSVLTLSPPGNNAECYRTYEAMEYGSIPIVEDIPTPATCKRQNLSSPYALLKEHKAPIFYVTNWRKELPIILKKFDNLPLSSKVRQRLNLVRWYIDFKKKMKKVFFENVFNLFDWNKAV